MTNSERPSWKFAVGVALPALVVLAAAIVAGWLVLAEMVAQVDRIESRGRQQSTQAALNSFLTRLREAHGEYAVWDDAVTSLYGHVDESFRDSNFRESSRLAVYFDSVYLLDENNHHVFGYQNGIVALRNAHEEFGSALEKMIDDVRLHSRPYDTETGFLKDRTGAIKAVAVGSILPATRGVRAPEGRSRLLVIARSLDSRTLDRLGRDFVLDGLTLRAHSTVSQNGLTIRDPLGKPLGSVESSASVRGLEALSKVAPTAILASVLACITIFFLLAIGFRNLLELRKREQEALRSAAEDGLTGLPNRRALSRALGAAVASSVSGGGSVGVIYLDLDGFKEVNDAYGHEAGDRLLKKVAVGFGGVCGADAVLARVGGDEFAVVMARVERVEAAMDLGNRMVRLLDEPIDIDGRLVVISTSAGVAVARGEKVSADELMRQADVAMYLAKEFGRNRVALYDPSIDAARADRLRLADDLRAAIREDRLAVVYQPIFDAATMRPTGVEALLRWLHPEIGLVPPDKFIPVAEESGLIERIGEWVLRRACRDALDWPSVKLSVNVSPVQFRNPGFDTLLAAVLAEVGFPADRLEIEMTETHLVANPDRAQAIIVSLRQLGVTVSLDDFGTGYSSIGYLRRFTFDKLKLDRSLVVGITSDDAARRLCEATIGLARALDLAVTAEGVETELEAAVLREAGCDHLQGYAFARPMTAEVVGSFLIATLTRPPFVSWTG